MLLCLPASLSPFDVFTPFLLLFLCGICICKDISSSFAVPNVVFSPGLPLLSPGPFGLKRMSLSLFLHSQRRLLSLSLADGWRSDGLHSTHLPIVGQRDTQTHKFCTAYWYSVIVHAYFLCIARGVAIRFYKIDFIGKTPVIIRFQQEFVRLFQTGFSSGWTLSNMCSSPTDFPPFSTTAAPLDLIWSNRWSFVKVSNTFRQIPDYPLVISRYRHYPKFTNPASAENKTDFCNGGSNSTLRKVLHA